MNTNMKFEKAFKHFYSMRLRTYMKKDTLVDVYENAMKEYFKKHGETVDENELRLFLERKISAMPKRNRAA